jgi:hypothetical protein
LQQWVRDLILVYNPELKADDVSSRSMGAQGEDVMLSPAARKWVPYQIECKNQKEITVYKWFQQAGEHGQHTPLLVIKQNHGNPLVVIDAMEFFKILRKIQELGNV